MSTSEDQQKEERCIFLQENGLSHLPIAKEMHNQHLSISILTKWDNESIAKIAQCLSQNPISQLRFKQGIKIWRRERQAIKHEINRCDKEELHLSSSTLNPPDPIHDDRVNSTYINNIGNTPFNQHEHVSSPTLLQDVITNISQEINSNPSLCQNDSETNSNHNLDACSSTEYPGQLEVDRFNASVANALSTRSHPDGIESDFGISLGVDVPPQIAEFSPIDINANICTSDLSQISNCQPVLYQNDNHQNVNLEEACFNLEQKQHDVTNTFTQPNHQESHIPLQSDRKTNALELSSTIKPVPNRLTNSSNSEVENGANSDARSTRKRVRFRLSTENANESTLHRKKKRKRAGESSTVEHQLQRRKTSLMHNRKKASHKNINRNSRRKSKSVIPQGDAQPIRMEYSLEDARYFNKGRMRAFYRNMLNHPSELRYQPTESEERWRELQSKFSMRPTECWGYVVKLDSIQQMTWPTMVGPIMKRLVGLLFFEQDPIYSNCVSLTVIVERGNYHVIAEQLKIVIPKIRAQSKRPIINAYVEAKDKELKRMLKRVGFKKTSTRKLFEMEAKDVGPVGARKTMISNQHGTVPVLMKGYVLRE